MKITTYPIGIDIAWIAFDINNHVAVFTTGGQGPIPNLVLYRMNLEAEYDIERRISELNITSDCQLMLPQKKPDDFVGFSRRGFFTFDWSDVHKTKKQQTGTYERISLPTRPLTLNQLPPDLIVRAKDALLFRIAFLEISALNIITEIDCLKLE